MDGGGMGMWRPVEASRLSEPCVITADSRVLLACLRSTRTTLYCRPGLRTVMLRVAGPVWQRVVKVKAERIASGWERAVMEAGPEVKKCVLVLRRMVER